MQSGLSRAGMIVITSGCATFTPWAAGQFEFLRNVLNSQR